MVLRMVYVDDLKTCPIYVGATKLKVNCVFNSENGVWTCSARLLPARARLQEGGEDQQ